MASQGRTTVRREVALTSAEQAKVNELNALRDQIAAAEARRKQLVLEVLQWGVATRWVAEQSGLNHTTVWRWAKQ